MSKSAKVYDLLLRARGDTRDAQRAMKQLQKTVGNFGRGVRNVGVGMTAAVTLPLVLMARTGIDELNEAQKASAQTAAVIKSTGGAAGVSAKHVEKLAQSLLKVSGVDDQVIQGGENILLTFTKIGAKDGIFDRATKASLDLSVAFGKDMSSSAVLVGKALQDPVKGVSALSRVGVSFSAKQKAVIKKLVETGQAAKAQKLILRELETQVGGSAKAFGTTAAGAVGILKERFASIAANMVTMLIPAFTKLAGWLERGMTWFEGLSKKTQKWIGIGALLLGVLGPILIAVGSLTVAFSAIIPVLAGISLPMVAAVAGIAALGVALVKLWRTNDGFRIAVTKAWRDIRAAVGEVLVSLRATLQVWGEWAGEFWRKWGDEIKAVLSTAFDAIVTVFGVYFEYLSSGIKMWLAIFRGDWSGAWDAMKGVGRAALKALEGIVKLGGKAVVLALKSTISPIVSLFGDIWKSVLSGARSAWGFIRDAVKTQAAAVVSNAIAALDDIKGKVTGVWSSVRTGVADAWGFIRDAVKSHASAVVSNAIAALDDVVGKVTGVWSSVRGGVGDAWGLIKNAAVSGASSVVSGAAAKLGDLIGKARDVGARVGDAIKGAINGVIRAWNGLKFTIPAVKVAGKEVFGGTSVSTPNIPELWQGGTATRSGLALVGERGPELLQMPRGASVVPLGKSRGGDTYNIYPQSQDVESIARRVVFLIGSGKMPLASGMA